MPSMGGVKYVLVLLDDHIRFSFCFLMKNKEEVFDHFRGWVNFVEIGYGEKVGQLQTDKGPEFMSGTTKIGIHHRKKTPYSPFQNGVAAVSYTHLTLPTKA